MEDPSFLETDDPRHVQANEEMEEALRNTTRTLRELQPVLDKLNDQQTLDDDDRTVLHERTTEMQQSINRIVEMQGRLAESARDPRQSKSASQRQTQINSAVSELRGTVSQLSRLLKNNQPGAEDEAAAKDEKRSSRKSRQAKSASAASRRSAEPGGTSDRSTRRESGTAKSPANASIREAAKRKYQSAPIAPAPEVGVIKRVQPLSSRLQGKSRGAPNEEARDRSSGVEPTGTAATYQVGETVETTEAQNSDRIEA